MSYMREFTKGLIKENPVLRLVLGTCPTLAVTTSVMSAVGMGASAIKELVSIFLKYKEMMELVAFLLLLQKIHL